MPRDAARDNASKEEMTLTPLVEATEETNLIIHSIACPFTILLTDVMVILAVKRRRRLQTKSNILLDCL